MASGNYPQDPDDPKVDVAADVEVRKARASSATSLDLSFRGLSRLPQGLAQLDSLQELDLRSNQITSFFDAESEQKKKQERPPSAVVPTGQVPGLLPRQLRVLRVSTNSAQDLGESLLSGLDLLKVLDLDSNRLRSLPVDLLDCSSLTELHLHRNQLEALPSSLGERLPLLKHLDVSYNMLKSLPESLGQLQHLEHLNARFNQLDKVPSSLGRASSLRYLDLSNNFVNLTTIPGTIGFLSNLKVLDLSNNQIATLPVQLGRLRSIEDFRLDGNPLIFPPREILTMDVPEAATGSMSKEEAAKAKAKATTEVVKQFLAAKLKEWDEQNGGTGHDKTWGDWLSDWPVLSWLGSYLAGTATPQLEGVMVSSAPRAALQPAVEPSVELQVSSVGVSVKTMSPAKVPRTPETEALVVRRSEQGEEGLAVSQQPETSFVAVPLLDESESEGERGRVREACYA